MAEGESLSEAPTVSPQIQAETSPQASKATGEISKNIGNPEDTVTEEEIPSSDDNPVLAGKENPSTAIKLGPEEQQAIETITSDPEYQRMLQEKILQAQTEDRKIDPVHLKLEVLMEYLQKKNEETEDQTESEQKISLTSEQKRAISKEFERAFKEIPGDMKIITAKTLLLRKAKTNKEELGKDANSTDEQKTKASESMIGIQKEYDVVLKKIENSTFGKNNQRAVEYLKESLDNAEMLKLLKKEKNKNLIMTILKMVFVMGFGVGKETGEYINPLSKMR